jgi:O-antigen/teichoic acid export membrane protein
VTVASLIGCAVAFVVIALWIPSLVLLVEKPWIALWFTLSTAAWSVFVIQDGILTGLRAAVWVLLKNTVFGFVKLALLAALAGGTIYTAVFTSWYAPAIVVSGVICLVIQREAGRIYSAKAGGPSVPVRLGQVTHFAWADYLGTLFLYAAMGLMPVFVLHRFGPESSAIYFLCWTIAHALYLVSFSLGASLVAEGAADANNIRQLAKRTQGHSFVLIFLGVLVAVPAAPWVLSLFGPEYSAQGTGLLRLLLLSALPFAFTCVLLNEARVMGHMKLVVFVQGALMVLVLGLGIGLSHVVGLIGTGIAWLSAQGLVALVLALPVVQRWARPQRRVESGVAQ